MVSVFWDKRGLLPLEFQPHKTTIKKKTYAITIKALRYSIKQKSYGKLTSNVPFLHNNTTTVHM